jgi:hypothetical protein
MSPLPCGVQNHPKPGLPYRVRGAKAELLGHVYAPTVEAAIAAAGDAYRAHPKRVIMQQVGGDA